MSEMDDTQPRIKQASRALLDSIEAVLLALNPQPSAYRPPPEVRTGLNGGMRKRRSRKR